MILLELGTTSPAKKNPRACRVATLFFNIPKMRRSLVLSAFLALLIVAQAQNPGNLKV
jgi:hypothetical protein